MSVLARHEAVAAAVGGLSIGQLFGILEREPDPQDLEAIERVGNLAIADLDAIISEVWQSAAWRVRPSHIIIPESIYQAMERLRRAKWKLARRSRITRVRARIARARARIARARRKSRR